MTMEHINAFAHKRIVLVDDSEDNLFLLENMLGVNGYKNIVVFQNPLDTLRTLEKDPVIPDLFLLDIMMPVMDGITLCKHIRENSRFETSSIIFVTARHGDDALQEGYEAGAQDFLRKPFSKVELLCRLKSLFTIQDLNRNLRIRNQELTFASITDGLTELYNRSFLDKRLSEEFNKCVRYKHRMSLMLMDIDHFKDVNDSHGHQVGDEVLKSISRHLQELVRDSDLLARYGGEEIALILSGANLDHAHASAERIREEIENLQVVQDLPDLRVTISIGVAEFNTDTRAPADLLRNADQALYRAKKEGRNLVRAFGVD